LTGGLCSATLRVHAVGKVPPGAASIGCHETTLEVLLKRILTAIVATALATSLATPIAGASATRAKLQLRKTSVGKILVNARGFTLYAFTKDGRNRNNCQQIPGCMGLWPAVATSGKAIAGPGVRSSLIGTITLKRGTKQVTYAGHPLYTYAEDGGPGMTFYVNFFQFGGFWPAVNAAGKEVK
jgi:predicted lipoprotein with Yx(FWY)xxD motif